jgi:hypothetical protein
MPSRYAEQTSVAVEKTQSDLKKLLREYKCDAIMMGEERARAVVGFKLGDKMMRFNLPLPSVDDRAVKYTPSGKWLRSEAGRVEALEQVSRSRWRALLLAIRAKLEAVAIGITTIEEEFLAHIVLPSGRTVGDTVIPEVQAALEGRGEQTLLPSRERDN